MKLLISFIFLFQSAWAQTPQKKILKAEDIIYNPGHTPGRFTISYKDYQDIRIDTDKDGVIDLWYVKKGPLEVEVLFENGQPRRWGARHTSRTQVKVFDYVINNQNFTLNGYSTRPTRLMNLEDACGVEQLREKIKTYANDLKVAAIKENVQSYLIDKSCEDKDEDLFARISDLLTGVLDKRGSIRECISSENFKNAFGETKEAQAAAELFAAKFELQALELSEKAKDHSPLLTCEKHPNQDKVMSTDESTSIIHIDISSLASMGARERGSAVKSSSFAHELIHRAGLKTEDEVKSVEKFCSQKDRAIREALSNTKARSFSHIFESDIKEGNTSAAKDSTATISPDAAPSKPTNREPASSKPTTSAGNTASPGAGSTASPTQTAASNTTASIPTSMTVAQTQMPAAPTLSESITAPAPATEAGSQQALVRSASDSSGIMKTANNLIGAMSTSAAAETSLASDRKSDSSTGSEKSAKADSDSSSTKRSAKNLFAVSRNKVSADERIVEQITIDGNNLAASVQTTKSARSAEQTTPPGPAAKPLNSGSSTNSEVARGNTSSGASSLSSFSPGTASGNSSPAPSSPSRGPANAKPGTPAPSAPTTSGTTSVAATSREEVITFISKGSYSQTKSKLQDKSFHKQLETQKITVLDLYGNTVGATKGEVIFLDQGDRFVRQK